MADGTRGGVTGRPVRHDVAAATKAVTGKTIANASGAMMAKGPTNAAENVRAPVGSGFGRMGAGSDAGAADCSDCAGQHFFVRNDKDTPIQRQIFQFIRK